MTVWDAFMAADEKDGTMRDAGGAHRAAYQDPKGKSYREQEVILSCTQRHCYLTSDERGACRIAQASKCIQEASTSQVLLVFQLGFAELDQTCAETMTRFSAFLAAALAVAKHACAQSTFRYQNITEFYTGEMYHGGDWHAAFFPPAWNQHLFHDGGFSVQWVAGPYSKPVGYYFCPASDACSPSSTAY